MTKKQFSILFSLCFFCNSLNVFAQREIPLEEDLNETKREANYQEIDIQENVKVYSIFNDFRIPIRENINTSDLKYDGWVTDPGMYTFRCRNGKRIRLTFWYLDKGPKEVLDSEFINVTPTLDKCQKEDVEYTKRNYRQSK